MSYSCIWRGDDGMCEYNGKKQLVKRHVENVHLKIRSVPKLKACIVS